VKSGDLKKVGEYVRSQVLNKHAFFFTDKSNDLNNYNKKTKMSLYSPIKGY
jgi:hypothetical protein